MPVEVGSAYITILPSARGFASKLQSEMGRGVSKAGKDAGSKAGKSFGDGIKGHAAAAGGVLAGVFAFDKVAGFLKDANAEARESQKVGALTTQVIKTTGGAANVSATQVGNLATALSNKTGIDDEAIQSGANMLLTFKNVRNEAGKGNDIFNQSTSILTDMSSVMGTEPKKAAIQLGKALNDPVKGISALSRVGVTFTDQQKETIKSLVKGGDTAKAQKIILAELKSEFGGAAAAQATMGEKASTAFANLKEAVGTALLPIIDNLLGRLNKIIPRVSAFVAQAGPKLQAGLAKAMPTLKGIGSALVAAFGFLIKHKDVVGRLAIVAGLVFAAVKAFQVWAAVTRAFTAVQVALNLALDANPIGLVVIGIAALIAGLILAYKKSKTFRDIVNAIGRAIKTAFLATVNWFKHSFIPFFTKTLPHAFQAVKDWLRERWTHQVDRGIIAPITAAKNGIVKAWKAIRGAFIAAKNWVSGTWKRGWSAVKGWTSNSVDAAKTAIGKSWGKIRDSFSKAKTWIGGTWKRGWSAVKGWTSNSVDAARTAISKSWGKIRDSFSKAKTWVGGAWKRGWSAAKSWLSDPVGKAKSAISDFLGSNGVRKVFSTLNTWGKTIFGKRWAGIKETFTKPISGVVDYLKRVFGPGGGGVRQIFRNFITGAKSIMGNVRDAIARPINKAMSWVNAHLIGTRKTTGINWLLGKFGAPTMHWIPGFVSGGATPNVGKFNVAGVVHGNEHVVTSDEVNKTPGGHNTWARLRAMVRGYAGGGRVWPTNTRRLSANYAGHSGVDIAAGYGAPIFATEPGRIAYTGWNHGYGQAIFERFASGLQAVYGHTSRLLTRTGQIVRAGQRIGLVGATGHATGPHLHFEINSPGPFGNAADRANSLAYLNGANISGKGGGGILSRVFDFLKGLSPVKWLQDKISKASKNFGGGVLGAGLAKLPGLLIGRGKDFLSRLLLGGGAAGSGSGSGKVAGEAVIRRALALNGVRATQPLVDAWWRQVLSESGDNPGITQRINDANSRSGNLARGWLQVIPSTFAAYHLPGLNNIFGKLDNAAAAINYAHHRYPNMLSVIGRGRGYDNGGFLQPGWAFNGTSKPEPVLTDGQWRDVHQLAIGGGSGRAIEFNDCQFGADPREVAVEIRRSERRRMDAVNLAAVR